MAMNNEPPAEEKTKREWATEDAAREIEVTPAAPSPAREPKHGLAYAQFDGQGVQVVRCLCGVPQMPVLDFNAHLRAEVRRETLGEVLEKWNALAILCGLAGLGGVTADGNRELLAWLGEQAGKE